MRLRSVLRKKYVITTDSKHSFPIANNVLDREFSSLKLGEKWISDITYIHVNDHWNYLTTIIDLADRKLGCQQERIEQLVRDLFFIPIEECSMLQTK